MASSRSRWSRWRGQTGNTYIGSIATSRREAKGWPKRLVLCSRAIRVCFRPFSELQANLNSSLPALLATLCLRAPYSFDAHDRYKKTRDAYLRDGTKTVMTDPMTDCDTMSFLTNTRCVDKPQAGISLGRQYDLAMRATPPNVSSHGLWIRTNRGPAYREVLAGGAVHSNSINFSCPSCEDHVFRSHATYRAHLASVHRKGLECNECDFVAPSPCELLEHT